MERRNTLQADIIKKAFIAMGRHATADEVYLEVAKDHPTISRATVYRNLSKLVELGELKRVEVAGEADRYDMRKERHYHVKCVKCSKIYDVEMPYMERLEEKILNPHGFLITGHSLMFEGLCPDCAKRTEEA